MSRLVTELQRAGTALAAQALREQYADPFWDERFGERGRKHASADGNFHVAYLVEALVADNADVFARYAIWLRGVLSARGMCSRHLAENFRLLGAAIASQGWEGHERAHDVLDAAVAALAWTEGDAGRVEVLRGGSVAGRHWSEDDDLHLSYLADALGYGAPERYVSFRAFADTSRIRAGLGPLSLERLAARLHDVPGARAVLKAGT